MGKKMEISADFLLGQFSSKKIEKHDDLLQSHEIRLTKLENYEE